MSQFVKLTGMDKRNIVRAIKRLEQRSMIFVIRGLINRYEINETVSEWREVSPEPPKGGRT